MSLPVLASDPTAIERAADPAQFVVLACERAKTWLTEALAQGHIEEIAEIKSQAEAIRVYTAQKQIGKDAELAATEIVRRAERGIGVAIRRGQAAGEIGQPGDQRSDQVRNANRIPPKTFFPRNNGEEISQTYAMADKVSDAEFNEIIQEARAEGNLSRKNVVRKVDAKAAAPAPVDLAERLKRIGELAAANYSSRQIAPMVGWSDDHLREMARKHGIDIPADAVMARTRKHDSNRIVRETVHALEGLALGVDLINTAELDPAEVAGWVGSLTNSIRVLNRLTRQMKEATQQ